jgi:hypothetical protein
LVITETASGIAISRPSQRRNPMDLNLLLIIVVLVLLFGGGGYWARGRYW